MSALLPVYPRLDIEVVRAEGTTLFTSDGREILDLYGAHAVCPLGHAHPELTETLRTTHATLDFYSNSLHMPVQEKAAEAVLGGSPNLAYVHFVNSGTEANEAAIHLARRQTGRRTIVTLDCSFHGRTLGSLSVTGLDGYRSRVAVPAGDDWLRTIALGADDLSAIDDTVAAVLIETVPSLAGITLPPEGWLAKVQARAASVGALVIADEVQAGVGRLGTWFGHESLGFVPDMVTLAKSLGGGFPVGALVTSRAVGDAVSYGELGTTFGGGPMACAMVAKVAEIIRRDGLMDRVLAIEGLLRDRLEGVPGVTVTGRGALLGVTTPQLAKDVRAALLARDILVGSSVDPHALRLLLPYVVSDDALHHFVDVLAEVLGD